MFKVLRQHRQGKKNTNMYERREEGREEKKRKKKTYEGKEDWH